MEIETVVKIDRDWVDKFSKDDEVIAMKVAIHIAIDPIDLKKQVVVYTDDGRGNGLPILSFDM